MNNKRAAAILGLSLAVFCAGFWTGQRGVQTVHAQVPIKATIPHAWGRCVASVPGGLVFEDSQGVVRMMDMQGNVQAQYDRN